MRHRFAPMASALLVLAGCEPGGEASRNVQEGNMAAPVGDAVAAPAANGAYGLPGHESDVRTDAGTNVSAGAVDPRPTDRGG
jgi:hypothetical protein